ncbi:MAG: YraN family protein [Parafannyhessea sp.]|uniref:YraN family protein n=1 Tax=Parafannyhessea sp. TaxID=2847324 RepID=UPI003EFC46C4
MSEDEIYGAQQAGYDDSGYAGAAVEEGGPESTPMSRAQSGCGCPNGANECAPEPPASDRPVDQLTPKELGQEGEKIAGTYLTHRGYEVIDRNWSCSDGEIDIVARTLDEDGHDVHVLVEVKTRLALGIDKELIPELAVDRTKQEKYRRLALRYLYDHPGVFNIRFDVIAVNIVGMHLARLRHLCGAFEWDQ